MTEDTSGDGGASDRTPGDEPGTDGPDGATGDGPIGDDPTGTTGTGRTPRHDRVRVHPTPGPGNSLAEWTSARNPLRVAINYVVVWLVRISPSLRLKRWLLRRIGVSVGSGVSWGLEATPDVFWPELITVEAEAVVGYDATLLCHEFLQDEYRTGEVVVGERAMIGAGAIVLPGVEIGPEASVAANSLVTRDVPAGGTVAGVPARPMGGDAVGREPDSGGTIDDGSATGGEGTGDEYRDSRE